MAECVTANNDQPALAQKLAEFLLTPQATFEDGANALLTADTQLNHGQNQETIRGVFVRRGILPNKTRKGRRAGVPFAETSARARRRRPSGE